MLDYHGIPEHMREGVQRYIEQGRPPGGFLQAVLENNLVEAFGKADEINRASMWDWANFLYNEMPMGSWGSQEKVAAWLASHRAAAVLER